jgi:hypothetical protein
MIRLSASAKGEVHLQDTHLCCLDHYIRIRLLHNITIEHYTVCRQLSNIEEFTDQVILENISLLAPTRRFYRGAMLETKDLERCCPLHNGHHEGQEPSTTLGQLNTLPLELLQPILLDPDLKSLTVSGSVNDTFRKIIDSIKEYDDIIAHASTTLRTALSINLGSWIS